MFPTPNALKETRIDLDNKLFQLDKQQKEGKFNIQDIGDHLPVGLLINHQDGSNHYMNSVSQKLLNYTRTELDNLGEKYILSIWYDMKDYHLIAPKIQACYQRNDETEVFSYFQRLKPNHREEFFWTYVTSKILKDNNSEKGNKRILVACPIDFMGDMSNKINKLLDENQYLKKNYKLFALLTNREKEIISLLYRGLTNPQIAEKLFISRHTIEQHRKNIKKKLDIKTTVEMIKFAEVFELY
jgi:DNA-binding CsgD family transcriptional regulator